MPDTAPRSEEANSAPLALSIVIPVYRGADSIGELVAALERLRIADGHEIVLVNDGSPDDSLRICRGLAERALVPITLVDLSRNYGEHNAVMAGLRHAAGAHVITMDDDLQHPPEEISRLLTQLVDGVDVVYGTPKAGRHSALRVLASRITRLALSMAIGRELSKNVSAFRVFRTRLRHAR
jgi:undecaprenyl-phosphate 4-deoxy-4-formamido-L-arabinose transferase